MKITTAAATGAAVFALTAGAACAENRPSVEEYAERVKKVAEGELQTWITDPILIYAIREQNEIHTSMTMEQIERLDRTWIEGFPRHPMIYDLLDRQASVIVRDRRELSNGVITEIIVMDRFGLNVAISDPTSDYYQGDEAKYQDTFLKGPGAVHVSEVEYDDSTGFDQTQVSMTVVDPDNGTPIGAVTFGINLEVLGN